MAMGKVKIFSADKRSNFNLFQRSFKTLMKDYKKERVNKSLESLRIYTNSTL